jgi:hypothetical protein
MRKAVVRGAMAKAVTAGRSEAVRQATSAAGEMLRARRDPSVVAARRVRSAQRRVSLWAAGAVVPAGGVAVQLNSTAGAFAGPEVLRTLLYLMLVLVCLFGAARAGLELRERRAAQRALPPPPPARTVVAPRIRPQMAELGRYSEGLRKLAGLTGLDPASPLAIGLRNDIITSADSAERSLRERAVELTDLEYAAATAPADARPGLRTVADRLASDIAAGVAEYGNYVTAVSEIVVAGRTMRVSGNELADGADKLRWLAVGMRELAG